MIRGTTATDSTVLYYKENIVAHLRCESVVREDFFHEAAITLRFGDETKTGRVNLKSVHPQEDIVSCVVVGEILGGDHHGEMLLHFQLTQDGRFAVTAPEEDLDPICTKTEILVPPTPTYP